MQKPLLLGLVTLLSGSLFAQSSSIQPNVGSQGQTLPIIISGQNTQYQSATPTVRLRYSQGSTSISQGSISGFTNIQVNSPTQMSGTLVIPGNVPNGSYDLIVSAGTSTIDLSAFTVQPPASNSITMVPNGVKPGNTLNGMTITVPGASFKTALAGIQKVWLSKGPLVLEDFSNINVQNSSTFTADFAAAANVPQGFYDMNIYENSGAMHVMVNAFEIDNEVSLSERPVISFSYFPNPAEDYLYLEYSGAEQGMSMEILDLQGRVLQTRKSSNSEGQSEFYIAELTQGTYLLRLSQQGKVLSVKKWQKH